MKAEIEDLLIKVGLEDSLMECIPMNFQVGRCKESA